MLIFFSVGPTYNISRTRKKDNPTLFILSTLIVKSGSSALASRPTESDKISFNGRRNKRAVSLIVRYFMNFRSLGAEE
jgi:hypothetical protein